jgi:hypothetical protein
MAPKRIGVASGKVKKDRKSLSVAQKLDIIKKLDRGERSKDICAAFNLSSSTVRSIYLQKDKLQDVAQSSVSGAHLHRIKKSRDAILEQLEKLLLHWIDSHDRKHSTLPFNVIQEKALSLFSDLKRKAEDEGNPISADSDFEASHGWFERFKKRANLQSIKVSGEKASTDLEAASASHGNELTNEELIQLLEGRPKELDEDQDEISEVKVLDTKTLAAVFKLANKMCNLLQDNDPNMERSSAFKRGMDVILACYHELYRAKEAAVKETKLDTLFRPKSAEPQSSTSAAELQPSTSATGPSYIDVDVEVLSFGDPDPDDPPTPTSTPSPVA